MRWWKHVRAAAPDRLDGAERPAQADRAAGGTGRPADRPAAGSTGAYGTDRPRRLKPPYGADQLRRARRRLRRSRARRAGPGARPIANAMPEHVLPAAHHGRARRLDRRRRLAGLVSIPVGERVRRRSEGRLFPVRAIGTRSSRAPGRLPRGAVGPFVRCGPTGAVVSSLLAWNGDAILRMPGGGSVVVAEGRWPAPVTPYRLVWMNELGAERTEATMPDVTAVAVSATGAALALSAGKARWYDREARTDWSSPGGDFRNWWSMDDVLSGAVALADGSVVVGLGTGRAVRFEPARPRGSPPGWVTSRAGATIAAVQGEANTFAHAREDLCSCDAPRWRS